MSKFLSIITFFYFFTFSLYAENVSKLEVKGNKRVGVETIKVYGDIKNLPSDFSRSDLDKIIQNLYETNFFENVSVQISNNTLVISLREYPIINQLVLIGEQSTNIKMKLKDLLNKKRMVLL